MTDQEYITEIKAHCSITHHALVALYKLCRDSIRLENIKDGDGVLDQVESVLLTPFPQQPKSK